MEWEPFRGRTVVGDVRLAREIEGRDVYAYLPPSHGSGRRFPVVYMHDGQNLFDQATAFNNCEWRVDETMEELARERIEAVVVGVSIDETRREQYAGARTDEYLRFLVGTVRTLVESSFDVDGRREATGIAGSSLGGLVSLRALYACPETFGFAGVFSPAFWFDEDAFFPMVEREQLPPARIYMDVGDDEGDGDEERGLAYVDGFERMAALLRAKGLGDELRAVLDRGGLHHETAWARRLPDALRFLLGARQGVSGPGTTRGTSAAR